MRRAENLQSAAAPLNNYQFDFGLPGMPKPSGSLKDQKNQPLNSSSQPSPGWSTLPGGWGASQTKPDQAFDSFGEFTSGTAKPNLAAQSRPNVVGGISSTNDFLGRPNPLGAAGGGYYANSKPQVGNVGGLGGFLGQTTQGQSKGVDLSGKNWSQSPASKLVTAGIAGIVPSSKEDVFGDLLGGGLDLGRSSGPLKQQASTPSGTYGMSSLNSSLPGTHKEAVKQTQATKPASSGGSAFSYTSMFKSAPAPSRPTSTASQPAQKPQPKGGDPFADISFTKPANGSGSDPFASSGDPFMFSSKPQPRPTPQATGRAPSVDPFAAFMGSNSGGVDQFPSMFGSGKPSVSKVYEDPLEAMLSRSNAPAAKAAQAHDGWGDAFGSAAENNSFENEGVTTELEGIGSAPAGVTGSTAFQKGTAFYKEGQFPNAIKWLSWAVELLQKEKGSKATVIEVLTKRISCFKEIGEYKKAIADCTMVRVNCSHYFDNVEIWRPLNFVLHCRAWVSRPFQYL